MMYRTHKEIIDAWPEPSLRNFAADHGVKLDTAKGWRHRKSIPPEQWPVTIRMATARCVPGVTLDVLSSLRTVGLRGRKESREVEAVA